MVDYWYPYVGHPDGESAVAWFRVVEGHGYRTDGNPDGPSQTPCFGVIDGWAYPSISNRDTEPTFQVVGSFVYAPQGAAWFRIKHGINPREHAHDVEKVRARTARAIHESEGIVQRSRDLVARTRALLAERKVLVDRRRDVTKRQARSRTSHTPEQR